MSKATSFSSHTLPELDTLVSTERSFEDVESERCVSSSGGLWRENCIIELAERNFDFSISPVEVLVKRGFVLSLQFAYE